MRFPLFAWVLTVALLATVAMLISCGSGSSNNMPSTGIVTTSVSDPAPCQAPNGPFSHVFVTITDVKIHASSTAGPNDPGWQDLTQGMAPTQVDLLGNANAQCLLALLGSPTQIPAGTYEQVRIMLLANDQASQLPNSNPCGNAANCVVLTADNSVHTLLLSSEAQTGLKIAPGQLAGGQFTVAAGQTQDLDIDFNACESIVIQGNGQYRLKPVLHGGEATLGSPITGQVVDSVTKKAIVGGSVLVALEQNDGTGTDRVLMQTLADANGNFELCPVPAGTYDVVIVAVNGSNVAYAATVTTGVPQGTAMGTIPLIAETGANMTQGTLSGQVTTTGMNGPTTADVTISALQPIGGGSPTPMATIPLVGTLSSTFTATTILNGAGCAANTSCVAYSLGVPAANPNVGAFNPMGTSYTQAGGNVNYTVDAQASLNDTADCTPPDMTTNLTSTNTPLTVTAGTTTDVATIAFTGCQ